MACCPAYFFSANFRLTIYSVLLAINHLEPSNAQPPTPSVHVQASMSENLNFFAGKTVEVHLSSGNSLAGIVKEVGEHFLHLEQLVGKEFYDALVCIKDIQAISVRARTR
jgi:hypothetical protein